MALDGTFLRYMAAELNTRLSGTRVDKIRQPERDELDITFRSREGNLRLLLSASPNNPRVHLTEIPRENPLQPPMFCMLLRKHLSGARFAGVEQPGLERILFIRFDCHNELGDEVRRTLAVEVMGRRSNIMLLDAGGRIMDAVKHVDEQMSSVRPVLPGLLYEMPPAQDKTSLTDIDPAAVAAAVREQPGEVAKRLLGAVQGLSPIVCREMAFLACRDTAARAEAMTPEQEQRLIFFLKRLQLSVREGDGRPVLVADASTGRPLDFSFLDITQYGTGASVKPYPDFSLLLDGFYSERDRRERVSRRAHDMLGVISGAVEHISRRIDNQRAELKAGEGRERLRMCGDLISSNMFRLHKGLSRCELENFYAEGSPVVAIELDPSLTPSQNAQKYYREYRKASVAVNYLRAQIEAGRNELEYLDTVFDELSRAGGETELGEIREELIAVGYLKNRGKKAAQRPRESAPLRFCSDDGFPIFVGRNNRQNDRLTLQTAAKTDIWLHTHNIPGAHVIISAGGRPVPAVTLTQAAVLAAYHSKAKESSQVPVDYAPVRNVRKPAGAKPGKVIYDDYHTAYVRPDPAVAERCRANYGQPDGARGSKQREGTL